MKDADAKRLLSFALYRTRLRHASFVDSRVTADKARVLRSPWFASWWLRHGLLRGTNPKASKRYVMGSRLTEGITRR